ncbi:MAG: glycosyltransferase 87 family protein, partial [Polyangiaceae bacterium]
EMSLFLVGAFALILRTLETEESEKDLRSKATWAALLAVAEGSLTIQRLDAVAAFFLALAFFAAVKRKPWLLGFAGGAAFAVKFVPALILPVLLAADPKSWTKQADWLKAAAGSLIAVLVGLGPIALAPGALSAMLSYHSARGLQVETTFATVLGALRMLTGGVLGSSVSFGSENLADPTSLALAKLCTPLTFVAIGAVAWIAFRASKQADSSPSSSPTTESEAARVDRMARALAGAAVLLWIFSKVLSPQYFTWGIPLILAIPWAASNGKIPNVKPNEKANAKKIGFAFCAALVVTQIYMRAFYESVAHQEPVGVVTMVIRQGLLFAVAILILRPLVLHLARHD